MEDDEWIAKEVQRLDFEFWLLFARITDQFEQIEAFVRIVREGLHVH